MSFEKVFHLELRFKEVGSEGGWDVVVIDEQDEKATVFHGTADVVGITDTAGWCVTRLLDAKRVFKPESHDGSQADPPRRP